ncbi:MAG: hypothetical protein JO025_11515, partial [Verrucomicrobia bacterium]|nr:hypothetical protein [Verrucomicrobiota bacterium]
EAHKHSEDFERALQSALPNRSEIAIHLEPRSDRSRPARKQSGTTQSVRDALSKSPEAAKARIRDVLVTDQGLVVTLERQFPGEMSLREAHEVMSNIERSLKLEIPNIAKVHVDPEIQDK